MKSGSYNITDHVAMVNMAGLKDNSDAGLKNNSDAGLKNKFDAGSKDNSDRRRKV